MFKYFVLAFLLGAAVNKYEHAQADSQHVSLANEIAQTQAMLAEIKQQEAEIKKVTEFVDGVMQLLNPPQTQLAAH